NDACSAPTRLLDMGVEPFLVASTVEAVLAQRLVRTICTACKTEFDPKLADHDKEGRAIYLDHQDKPLPLDLGFEPGHKLYYGASCRNCRNTGFAGRV